MLHGRKQMHLASAWHQDLVDVEKVLRKACTYEKEKKEEIYEQREVEIENSFASPCLRPSYFRYVHCVPPPPPPPCRISPLPSVYTPDLLAHRIARCSLPPPLRIFDQIADSSALLDLTSTPC
jgi:hypothetical protein